MAEKITRYRYLGAKAEATPGTPETITATEAKLLVMNPVATPDNQYNQREATGDAGLLPGVRAGKSGKITFDIEVKGAGSAALPYWASVLLPACDFTVSSLVVTAGRPTTKTTVTIGFFEDGAYRQLYGANGTVTFKFESGKPVIASFEFTGCWSDESESTMPTPTFETTLPPIFAASTLTIGGVTPTIQKMEIAVNNTVHVREDGTKDSAYATAAIVSRAPSGSMDPETVATSSIDWRSKINGSNSLSLSCAIGSVSNNTVTFASSTCQVKGLTRGDRGGVQTSPIELQFSGAAWLTITFS